MENKSCPQAVAIMEMVHEITKMCCENRESLTDLLKMVHKLAKMCYENRDLLKTDQVDPVPLETFLDVIEAMKKHLMVISHLAVLTWKDISIAKETISKIDEDSYLNKDMKVKL